MNLWDVFKKSDIKKIPYSASVLGFHKCFLPAHTTPASSEWVQSCSPHAFVGHLLMAGSDPVQFTPSSQIGPAPCPKREPRGADRAFPQPKYWHTTLASSRSQSSSQIVPQSFSCKISTLPEQWLGPFDNLISGGSEEGNIDKEWTLLEIVYCTIAFLQYTKISFNTVALIMFVHANEYDILMWHSKMTPFLWLIVILSYAFLYFNNNCFLVLLTVFIVLIYYLYTTQNEFFWDGWPYKLDK